MGILFDLLIPLLIVLGIAWAAIRSFMDRGKGEPARVNALRPGSYSVERNAPIAPAREEMVTPAAYTRATIQETDEGRAPRPRQAEARPAPPSNRATALRRTLQNPDSFRTAFILKEILGPPVGLGKDEHPLDKT